MMTKLIITMIVTFVDMVFILAQSGSAVVPVTWMKEWYNYGILGLMCGSLMYGLYLVISRGMKALAKKDETQKELIIIFTESINANTRVMSEHASNNLVNQKIIEANTSVVKESMTVMRDVRDKVINGS